MTTATLRPGERRYVFWHVGLEPAGEGVPMEFSLDDGESWHPLTWVSSPGEGVHRYRAMLAGPVAESQDGGSENPVGTVVVDEGRSYRVRIRRVDTPEIEIANAGWVSCSW